MGAPSGFGKDAALLFKSERSNVAATMRTPEKAESWTRASDLFMPKLDVTDRGNMTAAINQTIKKFGRIDVLVNNAGFALLDPLEAAWAENVKKQFGVH
jgi:NADP-dependent 3-hydroxy acid dehydrogenase YdfG